MWRDLFQPSHLIIVAVLVVILFGWKKLHAAPCSIGRSMRIFIKVSEMKNDFSETLVSAAAGDTVPGDVVPPKPPRPSPPAHSAAPQNIHPRRRSLQPTPAYQPTPSARTARQRTRRDRAAEQQRHRQRSERRPPAHRPHHWSRR